MSDDFCEKNPHVYGKPLRHPDMDGERIVEQTCKLCGTVRLSIFDLLTGELIQRKAYPSEPDYDDYEDVERFTRERLTPEELERRRNSILREVNTTRCEAGWRLVHEGGENWHGLDWNNPCPNPGRNELIVAGFKNPVKLCTSHFFAIAKVSPERPRRID